MPKRRYILESNLHHAFPDRSKEWRQAMVRENAARVVEMGLLVLALPHLSKRQLLERIHISGESRRKYNALINTKKPILLLVPHFTLYEYIPMIPGLMNWKEFNIAAIFRPLKNESLNKWVQHTRERYGVKLLSRQKGFNQARNVLSENGVLSVLFDQNARRGGTLMTYLGRIASTTELPRILAEHYIFKTFIFHSRRTSFWKANMELVELDTEEPKEIIKKAHEWMENAFSSYDDVCADWLWMHDRWKTQDHPNERFTLSHKKQKIDFTKMRTGYRLWIRLDDDSEIANSTLPLIKALKKGRPDARITILLPDEIKGEMNVDKIADHVIDLPPLAEPYRLRNLQAFQDVFPDTHLLLTQSPDAEQEAEVIQAPQRFGLTLPNVPRLGLTHSYQGNSKEPLLTSLEKMLRHFGLKEEISTNS